jgi:hypothetical protein
MTGTLPTTQLKSSVVEVVVRREMHLAQVLAAVAADIQ